jgi:antitoxin ParD1/3/4
MYLLVGGLAMTKPTGRDPNRHDKAPAEQEAFERLKAELDLAFAAPEESYRPFDIEAVIARNRLRHRG